MHEKQHLPAEEKVAPKKQMSGSVILIADEDPWSNEVVASAVAQTGRRLYHVGSAHEAFPLLSTSLEQVAAVVIDFGSGTHGLSILEAITFCKYAPPVIVIVDANQSDMAALVSRHGAAACINKPLNAAGLAFVIAQECLAAPRQNRVTSDMWGHPLPNSNRASRRT